MRVSSDSLHFSDFVMCVVSSVGRFNQGIGMKILTARFVVLMTSLLSVSAMGAEKQLTCPYYSNDPNEQGLLAGGAWRLDTIVFNPDDFSKDLPRLKHNMSVHSRYKGRTSDRNDRSKTVTYDVSSTELTFLGVYDNFYTVDRTTLKLSFDNGAGREVAAICEISDVDTPKNRAF